MKPLKLRKFSISDADILSRRELKSIKGGDYDDTGGGGGLTCVKRCACGNGKKFSCDCAYSLSTCLALYCSPATGVCGG